VLEIVSALRFGELLEDAAAEFPESGDRARRSIAEQLFELGERQFNGIQVGRVGRQVAQLGADGLVSFPDTADFVTGEVVPHHDVARF
jgi:hypothetical protein